MFCPVLAGEHIQRIHRAPLTILATRRAEPLAPDLANALDDIAGAARRQLAAGS